MLSEVKLEWGEIILRAVDYLTNASVQGKENSF